MKDFRFLYNRYARHIRKVDGLLFDWPTKDMILSPEEEFLNPFILKKGNLFIDVGANIGAWSIKASPFYDIIHAFEPNQSCFLSLQRNIHLNKCHNIKPYMMALDMAHGVTEHRINSPKEKGGQMSLEKTITEPLDRFNLKPSIMKIDVEGAGLRVIKGAFKTIVDHLPIIIMEVHSKDEALTPFLLPEYKWSKFYRDASPIGDWLYREQGKQVFLIGQ